MNVFDFVNDINGPKKDLMTGTENDALSESTYVPFVVNKALSYFPETILHANAMNAISFTDNKLQYTYYLNTIRPGKRFAKWVKRDDIESIQLVKSYYGYNTDKAIQALTILTSENLHYIKQKLQRGGNNDKARETD